MITTRDIVLYILTRNKAMNRPGIPLADLNRMVTHIANKLIFEHVEIDTIQSIADALNDLLSERYIIRDKLTDCVAYRASKGGACYSKVHSAGQDNHKAVLDTAKQLLREYYAQ